MMPQDRALWNKGFEIADKLKELKSVPYMKVLFTPLMDGFATGNMAPAKYEPWQMERFADGNACFILKDPTSPIYNKKDAFCYFIGKFSDDTYERFNLKGLYSEGKVNFKGWKCFAGVDLLFIDAWGNIWPSNCKPDKLYLGNVKDDTWQFPDKPVICPYTFCGCITDVMCRKEKIDASIEPLVTDSASFHPAAAEVPVSTS